ncbi:hypothetical protein Tco_0540746 [Tanacetum coccineum]
MSYFSGAASELRPYHFTYPERKLTMEEMLYKFIDKGKLEHEEMRAFICEFQTTNELLFKERNNSLSELRFGVQELLKVINNTPMIDCEIKGVTTRGGKTTTQDAQNNDSNVRLEEAYMITMNERCSAVLVNKLPSKEKDPGSFTIPCDIGQLHINNALADLEASISLMPYTISSELLENEEPDSFISIGLEKSIDQSDLEGCERETAKPVKVEREHLYSASASEINEKKLELKDLPRHLEYAYLHGDKSFLVIISSELSKKEKISLLQVLEERKGAIAWKMSDIKGISPSYCTHKIIIEDDFKPVIQPQRRLNPKVQDVVKNEIVKLLDSGLIYPISDSSWVSPIHVMPKKGGITVVLNDNNELIPSRTVTG